MPDLVSDPRIIAGYFIQEVEARMGCPRMIRSDHGTKNGHMQAMQVFMRETHHDSLAGPKSFVMGKAQLARGLNNGRR